jgi:hypothetical protein
LKFGLVVEIFPNIVANDYKSHVVVNGLVTFWLISTSGKDSNSNSLDRVIEGSRNDNLIKVIMEALMIGGGVPRDQIAQKLICFGANGVDVFQGVKSGVTKQIKKNYAPHSIGAHCMAHCTNLVMQILSRLPLVIRLENMLQTLHSYFARSLKRHLEFIKLAKFMQIKGNKILRNVKTRWISMLSLAKRMMAKYRTLLVKMALDNPTNQQTKLNYENLFDFQVLFRHVCILPLLEFVHAFIKFAQMRDVYVCDLVVVIKVCQGDINMMYCHQTSKFTITNFWAFKLLLEFKHENI